MGKPQLFTWIEIVLRLRVTVTVTVQLLFGQFQIRIANQMNPHTFLRTDCFQRGEITIPYEFGLTPSQSDLFGHQRQIRFLTFAHLCTYALIIEK